MGFLVNFIQDKFNALIASVFVLSISQSLIAQEDPMILDVKRSIPLSSQENIIKDYIISGGKSANIKEDRAYKIYREVWVQSKGDANSTIKYKVLVGQVKVINSQNALAIARYLPDPSANQNKVPMVEQPGFLIGDRLELASEKKLSTKEGSLTPDSGVKKLPVMHFDILGRPLVFNTEGLLVPETNGAVTATANLAIESPNTQVAATSGGLINQIPNYTEAPTPERPSFQAQNTQSPPMRGNASAPNTGGGDSGDFNNIAANQAANLASPIAAPISLGNPMNQTGANRAGFQATEDDLSSGQVKGASIPPAGQTNPLTDTLSEKPTPEPNRGPSSIQTSNEKVLEKAMIAFANSQAVLKNSRGERQSSEETNPNQASEDPNLAYGLDELSPALDPELASSIKGAF